MDGVRHDTRSASCPVLRLGCRSRPRCRLLIGAGMVFGLFASSAPSADAQVASIPERPDSIRENSVLPDENEPLADVRVEGNRTIPAAVIARHVKTRPGKSPTPDQVREDVRSLWKTGWFHNVEARYRRTDDGLVLVFKVMERPIVRKVEYRGNEEIKDKHLAKITGLEPGSPFAVSANRESVHRLEQHYHDEGYAFAEVKLLKGGSPEDREVVFEIREGPQVRVWWISITGNDFASAPVLKTKLTTKPTIPPLPLLWGGRESRLPAFPPAIGGLYDPSTIPDDKTALKQYYYNLGFFDVEVDHQLYFSEDRSRVRIEYIVQEGPRYRVRNIELQGNQVFSRKDLLTDLELQEGEPFNARYLNKDVEAIRTRYGDRGYFFANVDAGPQFLEQPGVADLVYQINEGRQMAIRQVNIHILGDNPHTKTTVARNALPFAPGDLADPRKIRLAKRRLGGVPAFENGRGPKGPRLQVTPVAPEDRLAGDQQVRFQNGDKEPEDNEPAFPNLAGSIPKTQPDHSRSSSRTADDQRSKAPPRSRRAARVNYRRSLERLRDQQLRLQERFAQTGSREGNDDPQGPEDGAVQQAGWKQSETEGDIFGDAGGDSGLHSPSGGRGTEGPFEDQNALPEGGIIRGQNTDTSPSPFFGVNPQGDPFDRALREPPGQVDVDIFLQEAQTGRLMFGAGVNSDAGVVGSIVLSEQNFDLFNPPTSFEDFLSGRAWRGGGQKFRLEAVPGSVVSRYLVSWSDPYFLDTNFNVGVSGFFYNRFFDDWDEQRGGGRVNLGYQLTPTLTLGGAFRLEEVVIEDPTFPMPRLLFDALGSSFLSSFQASLTHDTRDSPLLPAEGHLAEVSYEQAFGDFDFPQVQAEARQYFTLYSRPDGGGRHTLNVGGQLGWAGDNVPIFERFFAGGFQSFRGFEFRGVGPQRGRVRVGGRWMALGTVQYMFPLLANEMLHGVAFTDFGTVEDNIDFDQFRVTVGAGLRVTVPAMGPVPLAFDFGVPILEEDTDDTQIFSFYVGITR